MNASTDPSLPPPGAFVLVHGLGRFGGGREAVRHLVRRGCTVRVADRSDDATLQAVRASFPADAPIEWRLGCEDEALLDGIDLAVVGPAIPDAHPLLQAILRRGIPHTQEVELFLAAYPGRAIGVTGTNGKSSTSTLLHRALTMAGVDALLGGNIGHSLLADAAHWRPGQIAVLELSSFQLERFAAGRRLWGAVYTRVLRDHIDRHGTLAAYHAAKARLAASAEEFVVHADDDPVAAGYSTGARRRGFFTRGAPGPSSAGIDGGYVAVRPEQATAVRVLHTDALRLLGDFQLENVLAASLAAMLCGATSHPVGLALATAAPLPFRLQLLNRVGGVSIYDNGVSTEVESTRLALEWLRRQGLRVRWIGGGKSKDGDYSGVADATAPLTTSVHLFGDAAAPLSEALRRHPSAPSVASFERLADALRDALATARPGDAVLFSPAFASFDRYPNFRARALEFHALLREHGTAPERRAAETHDG